jgi:phosphoribosylformimino-5-aminoimidazole carboxamide ribotide isomerase
MELIGAIDLLDSRATRLVQGDFARPIATLADPIRLAGTWAGEGLRHLHLVDLAGARAGRPVATSTIRALGQEAREAAPAMRIEIGGGLRTIEAVADMLDGETPRIDDAILGSKAATDPAFVADCADRWPGRIGVSLDISDGRVRVDGWRRDLADDATWRTRDKVELAARLLDAGASRLVVTDIRRDGAAAGPSLALMATFRQRFPKARLVAAGGVRGVEDLRALAGLGMDGAIVGRALLDGSLTIAGALAACRAQATPTSVLAARQ